MGELGIRTRRESRVPRKYEDALELPTSFKTATDSSADLPKTRSRGRQRSMSDASASPSSTVNSPITSRATSKSSRRSSVTIPPEEEEVLMINLSTRKRGRPSSRDFNNDSENDEDTIVLPTPKRSRLPPDEVLPEKPKVRRATAPQPVVPSLPEIFANSSASQSTAKRRSSRRSQLTCIVCQSSKTFDDNAIVKCDECEQGYHQGCVKPAISDDVVKQVNMLWHCNECIKITAAERQELKKGKDRIRCLCNVKVDRGKMIQCEKCHAWQHFGCIGFEESDNHENYTCMFCKYKSLHGKIFDASHDSDASSEVDEEIVNDLQSDVESDQETNGHKKDVEIPSDEGMKLRQRTTRRISESMVESTTKNDEYRSNSKRQRKIKPNILEEPARPTKLSIAHLMSNGYDDRAYLPPLNFALNQHITSQFPTINQQLFPWQQTPHYVPIPPSQYSLPGVNSLISYNGQSSTSPFPLPSSLLPSSSYPSSSPADASSYGTNGIFGKDAPQTPQPDGLNDHRKRKADQNPTDSLVITRLQALVSRLQLSSDVLTLATEMYMQLVEKKIVNKFLSLSALSAACLLIACRKENVPTTFKEISDIAEISKKDLGKASKLILKGLDTSMEPINTASFLTRYCHVLQFDDYLTKLTVHVAQRACDINKIAGRCPLSVAAASLYMVCLVTSQFDKKRAIADLVGVSEATINSSYRIMWDHRFHLFPNDVDNSIRSVLEFLPPA